MKCPVCNGVNLVISERQGIEIDYCPDCRGVWLDRGELDKIIERSALSAAPQSRGEDRSSKDRSYDSRDTRNSGYKQKKKSSLLSELFDF